METIAAAQVGAWIEENTRSLAPGGAEQRIACRVALDCPWLADTPVHRFELHITLTAIDGAVVPVAATLQALDDTAAAASFSLLQPLRLARVHIPKPWGQEIWYTGVEQRGVCGFTAESGVSVPLPWLLQTLSPWLTGGRDQLVLLKILDPLPAEVWGDLYFELHEEKREVYVVTHVDPQAWPKGSGAIRFGFDPAQRARYAGDDEFRRAFRASVAAYEEVRREIDAALDQRRTQQGIALDAPVAPDQLLDWQQALDSGLLAREQQLRREMDAFSCLLPLRVGDVVKVPCYTPHALQHGVRTVEFQTPVYERKILSFAQKVLTQGHWDTDEAVGLMALEAEPQEAFAVCHSAGGVLAEKIVDFADFEVQRWQFEPGGSHSIDVAGSYALVMTIAGEVAIGTCRLAAEQACLLPGLAGAAQLRECAGDGATVLVALPR